MTIATTIKHTPESTTLTVANLVKPTTVENEFSDAEIAELAIKIKKMTPQQLAEMIRKSINSGLSADNLEVLITVSEQALKSNQSVNNN